MKKKQLNNPFLPGRIMNDPTRYAGRNELVLEAHRYLNDFRNVFITGQRGVGKSSLATQITRIIKNDKIALRRFGINKQSRKTTPNIVSYRCMGNESIEQIAENLPASTPGRGKCRNVGRPSAAPTKVAGACGVCPFVHSFLYFPRPGVEAGGFLAVCSACFPAFSAPRCGGCTSVAFLPQSCAEARWFSLFFCI